jgi:N-methylhydantoinase B
MSVTSMFERAVVPPYGLQGGQPGQPFQVRIRAAGGGERRLPGKANVRIDRGDLVIVDSCGGGGYGPATEDEGETA